MEKCLEILKMTKQDFSMIQQGKSMLLYKAEQHRILELLRALALEKVCSKLQSWWRGILTRKWYTLVKGLCASLKKACDTKNKATLERAITNFSNQMGSLQQLFNVEPRDLYQAKRILHALNEWDRLADELASFLSCDISDEYNFELLKDVLSLSHTHTHKYNFELLKDVLSLSLSLSLTHTHTPTFSLFLSIYISLSHTHVHSLTHSLSYSFTHYVSLYLAGSMESRKNRRFGHYSFTFR